MFDFICIVCVVSGLDVDVVFDGVNVDVSVLFECVFVFECVKMMMFEEEL